MTKILALFGALFTGGTLVLTNVSADDSVDDTAEETVEEVEEQLPPKRSRHNLEDIMENGFPYPSETFLNTLTEEQLLALTSYIDQVNETYDFSNMTDEELKTALGEIKEGMKTLFEDLGIELPPRPARGDKEFHGHREGRKGLPKEAPVEETAEGTDEV